LTAGSRQIFAFSRDGGLPFSRVLYYVSDRTHSPVRCVWFAVSIALVLGLLGFAGANAFGSVFSLAVTAQYFAYSISISARFLGGKELKPGPFSLGKFVCAGAVTIYLILILIFFKFFYRAVRLL
jgi:amino acid transporter